MFKNYYKTLELDFGASLQQIKVAYKNLAKRWHPDLNQGLDTNEMMQSINEAYLILNDPEAKAKYDQEYLHYRQFIESNESSDSSKNNYDEYQFQDEILKKWMFNASAQAKILATESLERFGIGVRAAGNEIFEKFVHYFFIAVFFTIIIFLFKAC